MVNRYAVIVAGGSGNRMKSEIPKQFLLVNGKPILVITLQKFLKLENLKVILALPEKDISYWETEVLSRFLDLTEAISSGKLEIVIGGKTRFQSVKNGLNRINSNEGVVAIHDGVRPFIDPCLIEESLLLAAKNGSAVLAVPSKDSVRFVESAEKNKAIERSKVWLIQTPQTFRLDLIKKAFLQVEKPDFTDDASVYESDGNSVFLLEGNYKNIKITTPEDLLIAETLIEK